MRKILFKAKRMDNKEYVFGDLLQFQDEEFIFIQTYENGRRVSHKIDRDTICQYTNVNDRRGMKIFEGDRVVVPMYKMEDRLPTYMKGTVEWRNGAFCVTWDDEVYGWHFLGYLEDVERVGDA